MFECLFYTILVRLVYLSRTMRFASAEMNAEMAVKFVVGNR